VLKADGTPPTMRSTIAKSSTRLACEAIVSKPSLPVKELVRGGFELAGRWVLSDAGGLVLDRPFPEDIGVYAFAKAGFVLYVGVATIGLAKRLYSYRKPGETQRTNQRLNGVIRNELSTAPFIEIYTAVPPDLEWNGLPIHGSAGLELGLIKNFALPWSMRSVG
jgi:hypothetical protein